MPTKPLAPFSRPLAVHPIGGEVAITGPGRLSGSLTPEAAAASARLLEAGAREALKQRSALARQTSVAEPDRSD
jgi:hypothetical protein